MKGSSIIKDRERCRKTIGKIIKRDLNFDGLNIDMIYNRSLWRRLIYIAYPT